MKVKLIEFFNNDVTELFDILDSNDLPVELVFIIKPRYISALQNLKYKNKSEESFNLGVDKGIYFVPFYDDAYPARLKNIYDKPVCLFFKGKLPDEKYRTIAVIGTRDCSVYGRESTRVLTRDLCRHGYKVISGMAKGIDGEAQKTAIEEKTDTYAVLGCGPDICYPAENRKLYDDILEYGGGIISEYPPGTIGIPTHFPLRNRIIAALSDGILVTEAREKSGTMITVEQGLDYGKNIFAIPGRIYDVCSEGTNSLIRQGAKLVTCAEDIFDDYLEEDGDELTESKKLRNSSVKKLMLERDEEIVYSNLSLYPKHIDDISFETQITREKLQKIITSLMLKNVIKESNKNYYLRKYN